jgi:serine/threonine protein kinase
MLAKNEILQGRYRIVRQLGHGGMGAVYEAIDERFGEPIALKEILIESINHKQKNLILKAFEREAKSLAKARHEAIPYVRDYFTELNRQFLVMELVEGEDLAELLEKRGAPFPLEDVLRWIDQLLDALDYLHNLAPPIIHRDIKPQNLKLSFRRKIKLLDFGIAKSGDRTSTITNQTFVGATLDYSPIEQILRVIDATFREFILLKHKTEAENVLNQNTDARCDIYALGATFYHLSTNRLPEVATKRTLAIWEGKQDPLPNPSQINPEIPPTVSACLLKAMEIERDRRFSSAQEMREALQTAIAEEKARAKEKTLPLIEPERLQIVEEKIPEQNPTQAVTEKLIPEIEPKYETEKDFISPASSIPTEPLNKLPSETNPSYETIKTPDTRPSKSVSESKLPEARNIAQAEENKEQSVPAFLVKEEANSKSKGKMFWLLPTAALGILTVSGIGGIVWLSGSDSAESNKPAANVVISIPTPAPTIKPGISPSVQPTPAPTQNKPVAADIAKPKPTVTPKRTPVVTRTERATPAPRKTPKLSEDCIYNGNCE